MSKYYLRESRIIILTAAQRRLFEQYKEGGVRERSKDPERLRVRGPVLAHPPPCQEAPTAGRVPPPSPAAARKSREHEHATASASQSLRPYPLFILKLDK